MMSDEFNYLINKVNDYINYKFNDDENKNCNNLYIVQTDENTEYNIEESDIDYVKSMYKQLCGKDYKVPDNMTVQKYNDLVCKEIDGKVSKFRDNTLER